jgi:hypothetical protein
MEENMDVTPQERIGESGVARALDVSVYEPPPHPTVRR